MTRIEKEIDKLLIRLGLMKYIANDYVRFLLAMACLIGAIVTFVIAMRDIYALMGW